MDFAVSVVIPTFNRASLIGETVQSILKQTHPPAEVIVVDDGSTDNTADILRQFGEAVRYERINNSGVCRARNVGIEMSRSPWIAMCDSDDLWRPDKLEWQRKLAEAEPRAEFILTDFSHVVEGDWERRTKLDSTPSGFWEPGRRVIGDGLWFYEEALYERLLRFNPVFVSAYMFHRDVVERAGGYLDSLGRAMSEDFEFTLRHAQRGGWGMVARPLAGIRKHPGNASASVIAVLLGDCAMMRYSLEHHPWAVEHREAIEDEIARRKAQAAELAFAFNRLDLLRELARDVPPGYRDGKLKVKFAVSALPDWAAGPLRRGLIWSGEAWSGSHRKGPEAR